MNDRDPITGLPRDPNAPRTDHGLGHEAGANRPIGTHTDNTIHKTTTTDRTVHTPVHVEEKRPSILPWILGGLALLGLLWWLFGRDNEETRVVDETQVTAGTTATTGAVSTGANDAANATALTAANLSNDLNSYFAGTDPLNRRYTLDEITFRQGSAAVPAGANATLTALGDVLKRYPNARVTLTGSASPEGDAAANRELSKQRADAVKNALVRNGVNANAITTQAVGETMGGAGERKVEMLVTAR